MAKAPDRDLSLKLRFSRLLFIEGYWSPIEVELSQYENAGDDVRRRSLTDLDVLGIKFDQLFTPHRVVGDCKTGKAVSDVNRLFWLRGIMDYFGADQGYFLRPKIDSHAKAIAPKMGLRVLADTELTALEKTAKADIFPLPLADENIQNQIADLWGLATVKNQKLTADEVLLKSLYSYLSYSYWYIEPYRNLLMLLGNFERVAHLLSALNARHVLLAYVGAERFALSLLEAASHVQAQGAADIPRYARLYLYGGPLALKDKEQFFSLLSRVTGKQEQLDPPSLPNIVELLSRLLKNPAGASDVLRHLRAAYICSALLGQAQLPAFAGNGTNTAAVVLAKDVALSFAKATGIPESLFSAMASL